MTNEVWGSKNTEYFYQLTPESILDAVEESLKVRSTGRIMAHNSMENRVYEIEIDQDLGGEEFGHKSVIAKFYRPGRWSLPQIQDEHDFLRDLHESEIPVNLPIPLSAGQTIQRLADTHIYFSVFGKFSGRSPDELMPDQLAQVGRLLARVHRVGATKPATHRLELNPSTFGRANLDFLLTCPWLPQNLAGPLAQLGKELCEQMDPLFAGQPQQRIHGDCHMGNLLLGRDGFFWIDFDDMIMGPPVQDLWLMVPGRDAEARSQMQRLLGGYREFADFSQDSLALIEPLRTLRFIHYASWIAHRWEDPAFKNAFPYFGTDRYWQEWMADLYDQKAMLESGEVPLR